MSAIKKIIGSLFYEPLDGVEIDGEVARAIGNNRWNRAILDIVKLDCDSVDPAEIEEAFLDNGCSEEDAANFTDEVLSNLDLIAQYTDELVIVLKESK